MDVRKHIKRERKSKKKIATRKANSVLQIQSESNPEGYKELAGSPRCLEDRE